MAGGSTLTARVERPSIKWLKGMGMGSGVPSPLGVGLGWRLY